LSAAVFAVERYIREGLDVPILNQYLDAIHIMAYDMHGTWDATAENHAPLYERPWDGAPMSGDHA
jgi:chitinase